MWSVHRYCLENCGVWVGTSLFSVTFSTCLYIGSLACLISRIVLNLGKGQETLLNLVVKGLSLVLLNHHVEYKYHAAMESFEKVQIRFCLQALICALLFVTFL